MVDSKIMRTKLLPSPQQCLSAIQHYLPELMSTRSKALLSDVETRVTVLQSQPADVEPFVEKVAMIESSIVRLPVLKGASGCWVPVFRCSCAGDTPLPPDNLMNYLIIRLRDWIN